MKAVMFIGLILILSGCASIFPNTKFLICGIDPEKMNGADWGETILGGAASFAAHITGHFIAAEVFDVDISLDGFNEAVDYSNNPSSNSLQWMARGGFLFQHVVNTALVELAPDSYFTKGFTAFTCIELLTYNHRHPNDGDFNFLDENGANGGLEKGLFLVWSGYNFYRISTKGELNENN